ncbi:Heterokaryon incompatibility protein 6, OR allele [Madurella mycetomatis]|uniref:Heterokaryon incompatibility protein 6, OR allele n=1 Tax=Madurella mycetomatis TaxID=100816 RepID=A0A175VUV2_9PEZI|nr:Heterokaryon incompatibility protein 6, OR allele [Madurella mycetomatis]KXX82656.1 Heterokaryon incompatibility protein 6, OR allele [Madurella mycetomatis]
MLDRNKTTTPRAFIPDPGPGRLSGRQMPLLRAVPQGSGLLNLPFAPDGTLSLFDLISGKFDENGVWHYEPIKRGIFYKGGHQCRIDIGTYEYNEGDYLYQEDGVRYLLGPAEAVRQGRVLGLDRWAYLQDSIPGELFDECIEALPGREENKAKLCDLCKMIDLNVALSALHKPVEGCDLCRILRRCPRAEDHRLVKARDHIRICSPPNSRNFDSQEEGGVGPGFSKEKREVHPGFPTFFKSGSQSHFRLVNHWLRLCDEGKCGHEAGCAPPSGQFRPTRLLRVSPDSTGREDIIPIIATSPTQEYSYVALSHCWGSQHSGIPPWCTTRANLSSREAETGAEAGIPFDCLPANFRDAILVTRALGKGYLWVDSLCIIQGDEADWKSEASKMADVFRGAYCVVAASSAEDSTRGFLNRIVDETQHDYVLVNSASHGEVYLTTAVDDFAGDVQNAVLNSRAWVFQERALARRTLHFTKHQTYFECGGGVRCETGTYMKYEGKPSLFSDPSFPHSLQLRVDIAKVKLFSEFFETYSSLGITRASDRPIAILALARELAKTLDTKLNHGVFESFLHRGLLWHRKQPEALARIEFGTGRDIEAPPPSWSWMAHKGGIAFAEIQDYFEWDVRVAFSAESVLWAPVGQLRLEAQGKDVGSLWFDDAREDILEGAVQHVVVVGRQVAPEGVDLGDRRKVYVLLVDEGEEGAFKRVGMGMVDCGLVRADDIPGKIM